MTERRAGIFDGGHYMCVGDPCELCAREAEREDWLEERHAFQCDGHEDDLMPPFACGWCGTMVGTNGAQDFWEGGIQEMVPIWVDSSGTAWHTLCALEEEMR